MKEDDTLRAAPAQQTGDTEGQNETHPDTLPPLDVKNIPLEVLAKYLVFSQELGTESRNPASLDAGLLGKRAKGVEPSTFTLAT
jgi:hypothetical protein